MAVLRLFAVAREAAGTGRAELAGATVSEVLEAACARYGPRFSKVLGTSRVWVNGVEADPTQAVGDADEVAVLPPVSGGAVSAPAAAAQRRDPLLPPPDLQGPKILLGLVWAALTLTMLAAGPVWLGLWLAALAALASAQACRTWRRAATPTPYRPAVAAGVAIGVASAGFGTPALVVGGLLGLAVVGGASGWSRDRRGRRSAVRAAGLGLLIAVLVGGAAAAPVSLRATTGLVPGLVLLTYVAVYDAGAFLIGAGARRRWEGPAAGIACIAVTTVAVAAIFPQFGGSSPWGLGALAAVTAPLGPVVGTLLLGSRRARAPAVRRLDTLLVMGPAWALAAAAVVR